MPTMMLSDAALALLRLNLTGPQVPVTPDNHEAYRELAAAGLMEPLHTFAHGRDSAYRLTEVAVRLRAEVLSRAPSTPPPSPAESALPRC